jgi:hypothetical protein
MTDASGPSVDPPPAAHPASPENPDAGDAALDIHKPKPVHNLREFLGEILVIVTGVLIALGLEQVVETWHWHHQVENAEQALGTELSETLGQANERIKVSTCVDKRLDELAALIDTASVAGKLPPVGDIAMPPARTWSAGVWQSTLDGQTSEHFPADVRNGYSVVYGFVTMLAENNARELDAWTRLYGIVGPGRALTPTEADSLRQTVSDARTRNQMMGLASVRAQQVISSLDIEDDKSFVASFDQPQASYAICQPIGKVPAHYGAAPIADAIARARGAPIGRGSAGKAVAGASER